MSDELIQLPEANEIKEFLKAARQDIDTAVKEEPELKAQHTVISEVIQIMEDQVANKKDLNKFGLKERISFAAHLNFLQCLLEDFFMGGEEFDEEDLEEGEFEESEFEEIDEKDTKKKK